MTRAERFIKRPNPLGKPLLKLKPFHMFLISGFNPSPLAPNRLAEY
jgi:hypothetical protein